MYVCEHAETEEKKGRKEERKVGNCKEKEALSDQRKNWGVRGQNVRKVQLHTAHRFLD